MWDLVEWILSIVTRSDGARILRNFTTRLRFILLTLLRVTADVGIFSDNSQVTEFEFLESAC